MSDYKISAETMALIESAVDEVPEPEVATKECPKCNHTLRTAAGARKVNGRGRWINGGACFKCGGAGVVPATRADQRALNKAKADRDVIRYRLLWVATRDALKIAQAAADKPKPPYVKGEFDGGLAGAHYKARRAVRDLTRSLGNIEAHGKLAVELAANPHARAC